MGNRRKQCFPRWHYWSPQPSVQYHPFLRTHIKGIWLLRTDKSHPSSTMCELFSLLCERSPARDLSNLSAGPLCKSYTCIGISVITKLQRRVYNKPNHGTLLCWIFWLLLALSLALSMCWRRYFELDFEWFSSGEVLNSHPADVISPMP